MSMSRDRVHFELDTYNLNHATRKAFKQAFGTDLVVSYPKPGSPTVATMKIICRPSQFARFLIYREMAGGQNLFKALKAHLEPAELPVPIMDVSSNQNVPIEFRKKSAIPCDGDED
jgi:hypothetical protein